MEISKAIETEIIESFKIEYKWDKIKTTDKLKVIRDNMNSAFRNSTIDKGTLVETQVRSAMIKLKTLDVLLSEIEPTFIESEVSDLGSTIEFYFNILFNSLRR